MTNYTEKIKEIVKALEENEKLFRNFISSYSEITLLGTEIREKIANVIDEAGIDETCYSFFGTEYDTYILYQFTMGKYYIDDFEISDYSVLLKENHDKGGDWLPVVFIKEFWDFYFDYISKKRENEKTVCLLKLGEELKQNEEQNETNIDDICRTIAKDFVKNYGNYTDMFNTLNCFSNVSESNCVELFANFLKRLF